jgi:hypothetical protein
MSLESRSSYNYGDDSSSVVKLYICAHKILKTLYDFKKNYAHQNYSIKTINLYLNKKKKRDQRYDGKTHHQ